MMKLRKSALNRGYLVRGLTIVTGGASSVLLTNMIISTSGNKVYALFVVLTSLPSLFPFLDFGLGANVFNFYVDHRDEEASSLEEESLISTIFLTIMGIGLSIFLFFLFAVGLVKVQFIQITYWDGNVNLYLLLIVGITILAAPFSIGSKKLHAESRSYLVWSVEGAIPIFSFLLIGTLMKIFGEFNALMLLVPSLVYLACMISIFFLAGLNMRVIKPRISYIKYYAKPSIKLGVWSLLLTTSVALTWQIPKYVFNSTGNSDYVAKYGILSMILLPAFSLLNVSSAWLAPAARLSPAEDLPALVLLHFRKTMLRSLLIGFLVCSGVYLLHYLDLPAPNFASTMVILLLLLASPAWIIPFSAFSNQNDMRWLSMRIAPVVFLCGISMYFSIFHGFYQAVLSYYLTIFCVFSVFAWFNINRKRKI